MALQRLVGVEDLNSDLHHRPVLEEDLQYLNVGLALLVVFDPPLLGVPEFSLPPQEQVPAILTPRPPLPDPIFLLKGVWSHRWLRPLSSSQQTTSSAGAPVSVGPLPGQNETESVSGHEGSVWASPSGEWSWWQPLTKWAGRDSGSGRSQRRGDLWRWRCRLRWSVTCVVTL